MSKKKQVKVKINKEVEEKVQEAYVRKGPSKRYKRNVVPIKIWVSRCGKSDKGCYRTYYVASRKKEYYTELAKRALKRGEIPQYLLYYNEVGPRFKQLKIKEAWQRKFLGDTFTNQFAHLSGFVFSTEQRINRRIARGYGKVISSIYDAKTGTHTVVMSDGTRIDSTFRLGRRGGISLKTRISTPVQNADGSTGRLEHNATIEGSIKVDRATGARNLKLSKIRGYDLDSFLGFMDFAQSKFRSITATLEYDRPNQIKNLLLAGFGENVELTSSDKSKLIQSLHEKSKKDKKLVSDLSNARTLSEFITNLVKKGLISSGEPIYSKIVELLEEKGIKELEFRSVSEDRDYTFSQHILHSVQLQRSVENDYHKGFRKYRLPGLIKL